MMQRMRIRVRVRLAPCSLMEAGGTVRPTNQTRLSAGATGIGIHNLRLRLIITTGEGT